ncbi:recombinase family protein [Streptomyces sp. NPDC026665]|uniref:recombinase family protein n=1 Tax=Streptomyces sp. NPDC026665 TaxID=3154798 RepID=UPI0033E1EEF4
MERLRAREYRRLSDKKGGTSLDDQGSDNAAAADEQDYDLGDPYIDDGLSASRYARGRRGDFDQLVADLQTGPTGRDSAFGADILMLWESSRGSRRVGEWVSFIELCEDKGVKIWVTTHERLYDPANGRDRKALIDDANDSEYESYKTHRRVSRTTPKEAAKGRPHGEAPYGLKPVYDDRTGKLITWTEDPKRSMVPKELFEMLEAGHSLSEVTRHFERKQYVNKSGRAFSHAQLRSMAVRHSYAGLRHFKGTIYPGIWDGIVSEKRFWAVHQLVTDPDRVTNRGGFTRHVLTAGLWCARCDINLTTLEQPGRKPVYRCTICGRKIQKAPVDDLMIGDRERRGVLLAFLSRPDLYATLRASGSDDAEVRIVQDQLARARAERDELRKAKGATLAEVRILANSLTEKEREVDRLASRENELTVPAPVLSIIRPGVDVWDSWHDAPLRARRLTVRLIFSATYLGRPCILPSPRQGWNQAIVERIEWRRTAPSTARRSN